MVEEIFILIRKAHRRQRRQQYIICLAMMLIGAAMILSVYLSLTVTNEVFVIAIGVILILAGVILLGGILLSKKTSADHIIDILKNDHDQIVWIYHYIVQTMPYGVATNNMITIYFCFANGERSGLKVKRIEVAALLELLRIYLPKTTFGHSNEKDQLYRINPMLLKKD